MRDQRIREFGDSKTAFEICFSGGNSLEQL